MYCRYLCRHLVSLVEGREKEKRHTGGFGWCLHQAASGFFMLILGFWALV